MPLRFTQWTYEIPILKGLKQGMFSKLGLRIISLSDMNSSPPPSKQTMIKPYSNASRPRVVTIILWIDEERRVLTVRIPHNADVER